MSKRKEMTPEDIQLVKAHFKSVGYGDISDETARAQTQALRLLKERKGEEQHGNG